MNLAVLRNNSPYYMTLPYPLAGVLAPGEVIVTRYTTERLGFLLGLTDRSEVRTLVVTTGPDSGTVDESKISPVAAARLFAGYAETVDAASAPIIWHAQGRPSDLKSTLFTANSAVTGILTIAGNAADGTNVASYRRQVTMLFGADGTLVASSALTIGTDYETQAGTNVTLTFPTSGMVATVLGVAGETYRWTASFDVQAYSLNG